MEVTNIKVKEISFHRNGICGLGFYAVIFLWKPEDSKIQETFIATVFDEPGSCAVISIDRLQKNGVGFGCGNSWRGDRFEKALRRHIEKGTATTGTRFGPFAIPPFIREKGTN